MGILGRAALGVGIFLICQAHGVAQEVTGRIEGRVDGVRREWFVTRDGDESRSEWSGVPGFQRVTIFGNAGADQVAQMRDALILDFDLFGDAASASATGVEIRLLVTGFSTAYMARPGDGARVAINALVIEGDRMKLRGTFSGRLGFSDSFGARVDASNTRFVDGQFEVVLDRQ